MTPKRLSSRTLRYYMKKISKKVFRGDPETAPIMQPTPRFAEPRALRCCGAAELYGINGLPTFYSHYGRAGDTFLEILYNLIQQSRYRVFSAESKEIRPDRGIYFMVYRSIPGTINSKDLDKFLNQLKEWFERNAIADVTIGVPTPNPRYSNGNILTPISLSLITTDNHWAKVVKRSLPPDMYNKLFTAPEMNEQLRWIR